jgi:hypothetical protein
LWSSLFLLFFMLSVRAALSVDNNNNNNNNNNNSPGYSIQFHNF